MFEEGTSVNIFASWHDHRDCPGEKTQNEADENDAEDGAKFVLGSLRYVRGASGIVYPDG